MTEDDLDREIARLERHERERDEGQQAIAAAARERFADVMAGIWVEDDQETLVIAVTHNADTVARTLAEIAAGPLNVVTARYTLAELERLCEQLWVAAEGLGAPLSATGVIESNNAVQAMLGDLAAASSRALRERFADRPIVWVEGTSSGAAGSRAAARRARVGRRPAG